MLKTITATELKKRLEQDQIVLIDVREPAEHEAEYIEGSCLIPMSIISSDKLPDKSHTIVIHCRSGKRCEMAYQTLAAQDPSLDLYSLQGGIEAWKQAGFAVKSSGRKVLPLDRQMQVSAGALVFLGVVASIFLDPWFLIIPGFVGLGLMFAGISGWCGMMKLLAKMPWNK